MIRGLSGAITFGSIPARVLAETRTLRDGLVDGVLDSMQDWREMHLIRHAAVFDTGGRLIAGGRSYRARSTIIATGSRPVVPVPWRDRFCDRVLTSDDLFEIETLPRRMAVVGLGSVEVELGQALARLGGRRDRLRSLPRYRRSGRSRPSIAFPRQAASRDDHHSGPGQPASGA